MRTTLHHPNQIQHSITTTTDGTVLSLWETPGLSESKEKKPFLFKINQRVASWEEAQRLLRQYLEGLN